MEPSPSAATAAHVAATRDVPASSADLPGLFAAHHAESVRLAVLLCGDPHRAEDVAVVLRYWLDLPEREVAEAMDVSVGTVKSTTSRALDKLRRALEEDR